MHNKFNSEKIPKDLETEIEKPKQEIDILDLPVTTFFAVHKRDNNFDAAELDHYRRITVFKKVKGNLIKWLTEYSRKNKKKIIAVGFERSQKHTQLTSELWLKHDIVPHIIVNEARYSIKTLIQYARLTSSLFSQFLAAHPLILERNRVVPSFLVNKGDYQKTATKPQWEQLEKAARELRGRKIRFFSATPQGGGVALMRHAIIRLMRLLDVDCSWHVLYENPAIFKITKNKFHDILQNVAPDSQRLTNDEKQLFTEWSGFNARQFKDIIQDSDVIFIDDPQPAGLIPHIKKINPAAKIIYRSHIQIESHLAGIPGTAQFVTWDFISSFLKDIDIFVPHPIKKFIPSNIGIEKTISMPATTDPLDGLNKPLSREQTKFYIGIFNKYLIDNNQTPLSMDRDYLIQVARFDPSKGIPDLLEAFLLLRQQNPKIQPQLVITGHGSVDDPDGIPIMNYVQNLISKPRFNSIAHDIKIARLPHVDQPLNALLREAKIALQLSYKEGFEVKVTEALMKGIPVVAYNTGGIPLQIKAGINGFLIETGNFKAVAEQLNKLLTDNKLYKKISRNAKNGNYRQYQTVANARRWLFLANLLLSEKKISGNGRSADELIK